MESNDWTFENIVERHFVSSKLDNVDNVCWGPTWYGWCEGNPCVAHATAKFKSSGSAELTYENCLTGEEAEGGKVEVRLNEEVKDIVGRDTIHTIKFDYNEGDVLIVSAFNIAIMKLNVLKIECKYGKYRHFKT